MHILTIDDQAIALEVWEPAWHGSPPPGGAYCGWDDVFNPDEHQLTVPAW